LGRALDVLEISPLILVYYVLPYRIQEVHATKFAGVFSKNFKSV